MRFKNHSSLNWLYFYREEVRIIRFEVLTIKLQIFCNKFATNTLTQFFDPEEK